MSAFACLAIVEMCPSSLTFGNFRINQCRPDARIQRTKNERFTIQDAIDLIGANATSIESEIVAGRPGYVWNYENARIILPTDEVSKKAVVDAVPVCMVCQKTDAGGTFCQGVNEISYPW